MKFLNFRTHFSGTSEIENNKVSPKEKKQFKLNNTKNINKTLSIEIQDGPLEDGEKTKVFGVYDPEENDFDLNMHTARLLMSEPFFAAISRRINKRASYGIPTAGVMVNKETAQFEMLYNPDFFASLTD